MWRKFFVFATILLLVSADDGICASVKREKYSGPLLTGCSVYQLGGDEFVLQLSGKKLPVPTAQTVNNDSLVITLDGTRAEGLANINSSAAEIAESMPIITDFEVKFFSPDQKVVIHIESSMSLKVNSPAKTRGGYTFRISGTSPESSLTQGIALVPPKSSVLYPQSTLPFSANARITIELREIELMDAFRLLMNALGRTALFDKTFPRGSNSGSTSSESTTTSSTTTTTSSSNTLVTMSLNDVRIDDVLNYLMRTYDLACYQYAKNITAFGTRDGLYRLSGEKEIKSFRVSYAEPAQAVTLLKTLVGLQDSEIIVDERMRTLYLNTNPARIEEAEKLLKNIDLPAKQVMIRASIFEFSDSATKDVQAAINAVYDEWTFISNFGEESIGSLTYTDMSYRQGRSALDRYITATLNSLETKDKGKTIANPSVIAIDGQEATINLKQDIMYRAGINDKGNIQWDTTEVGPELKFKPKIEDNGYIYLEITINTGDYLGSDNDGNIRTANRTMTTKIRVRDGMPFVVGGLFQEINTSVKVKVPILGDIPLIGLLFRSSSKEKIKSQAVMIVTPYILDTK